MFKILYLRSLMFYFEGNQLMSVAHGVRQFCIQILHVCDEYALKKMYNVEKGVRKSTNQIVCLTCFLSFPKF